MITRGATTLDHSGAIASTNEVNPAIFKFMVETKLHTEQGWASVPRFINGKPQVDNSYHSDEEAIGHAHRCFEQGRQKLREYRVIELITMPDRPPVITIIKQFLYSVKPVVNDLR